MKEKNWLKLKTIIMVLAKTSVDQLESKDRPPIRIHFEHIF